MIQSLKLLFYFLGYQLLSAMLMVGVSYLVPLSESIQLTWSLLLANLFVILHLFIHRHVSFRNYFNRHSGDMSQLCGCFFIFGISVFSNVISEIFPLPNWLEADFFALSQTFLGILAVCVVGPYAEELLFRGAIMSHLSKQGFSPRKVIFLSALLFGLIHMNPAQMPFAFIMGLAFGWVTWRTGSLKSAIVSHIFNNFMALTVIRTTDEPMMFTTSFLVAIALCGLVISIIFGYFLCLLTMDRIKSEQNNTIINNEKNE